MEVGRARTKAEREMNTTNGFEREPGIDRRRTRLSWDRSIVKGLRRWYTHGAWWRPEVRRRLWRLIASKLRILSTGTIATRHLVGRHPAGVVVFRLDLFPPHLLHEIRNADPQHSDRQGMIPRLVVHRKLDFIALVDAYQVELVGPSIVPGGLRPSFKCVLYLDINGRLRSARESSGRGMIDVLHRMDPNRELAG